MLALVRCGETAWGAEGRLHSTTDLPLTSRGRDLTGAAARRLLASPPSALHHPADEAAADEGVRRRVGLVMLVLRLLFPRRGAGGE